MTLLKSWGVRIIVYIDDMLVLGESQDQAPQHLETLLWVLQALGFTINWEKSIVTPTQQIEFLGLVTDSRSMELSLLGEKLRQIRGEALKILSQSLVSARTVSANWETEHSCPGSGSSSPVLPLPPRQLEKRPCLWQPWLRQCDNSVSRSSGRAYLVAAASQDMEWQMPPQGSGAGDNSLRCLPIGLGSNMRGHSDRQSVVRAGEDVAHQLPRDAGSCPCNPDLSEGSNWVISVTANGQYHCSGLRQQPRGNSIPTVDHPGEDIMDVGTPEGHHVDNPIHTRCVKYSSGHRIQDGQGPYRLEIEPRDLQPDQPNLWATKSGLVCIQTDSPIASLLQLETRPASRSNGCFLAGLETQDWVCQLTLVPYGESSESSDETGNPDRPSGSSVEGSTLVPSPSESIVGVPSTDPLTSRPDSEPLRTGAAGTDAPASRVAYLREKFNESSLSEEASIQVCCWPPGGPSQASLMTHTSGNGLAGVLNEVPIPFQDL